MRIAIVGTGVSGLVAAHALHCDHDVTLFEADARVGGHAHTVDVEVGGVTHAVDTGFIVYNEANYPGFTALLRELHIETQTTQMSFSVADGRSGLEYRGSNLNTFFAQRRNLARPSFLRLATEIMRFNGAARRLVAGESRWRGSDRLPAAADDDGPADESIESFLQRGRYSRSFVDQFLVPFGSAIWSADPATFTRFPMRSYARFMDNHGLLGLPGRAQWRTITGGSRVYVDALVAPFADRIRLATAVHKIVTDESARDGAAVEVLTERGPERFDRVIVAAHSDQALEMLGDATPAERSVLGAISYQRNRATLHTDARLLPRAPRARASWNYWIDPAAQSATVTYWMNALQAIVSERPLLLTLNRADAIDPECVLAEFDYAHPVFDAAAMQAQRRRPEVQGKRGIYFAGAYWGYGFHEDGVQSGLEVARRDPGGPMTAVAIYEGTARHRRFTPAARDFAPRLFLAYLDVDALPGSLDRLPGWSGRRRAPVQFRRRDFFDGQPGPLGDAVRDLVEARLGRRPVGPIHLLAQLRTFGWLFNPLVVYYCSTADGAALDALVLEVTNTPWGERSWYVLDARTSAGTQSVHKAMHVSPFLPMDVDYEVAWTAPGNDLGLEINVVRALGETLFSAGLALRRSVLDRRTAIGVLLRHPALPLRVSLAIYRKALALFLARVPLYGHPTRPAQEVCA